ncbi:MAG: TonB-dependent receptor [Rhodospirillales bacterium]|nr:TonB-dependent receptor [Rhodospirillales bacterium]MCB9997240.1 TonB-dependent receptor [Rhodospirillales bacterium]
MINYRLFSCVSLFSLMMISAAPSMAAGFYIQEQSVSGLGRAFAGSSAHPVDSSTVYYNPAGMTYLKEAQGQVGVHLLHPKSDFTNAGSQVRSNGTAGALVAVSNTGNGGNPYSTVEPVPNLFISQPVYGTGLWMGIGITAPFGLSNEYDDGWFGRYDSTSSALEVIDVSPSIACNITDTISLGGGINVQHANADLRRAIPDPTAAGGPTPATDGELILEGDSWAVGYNMGLIWEPEDHTRIGLHYRSEVNHRLKGALKGTTPAGLGRAGFFVEGEADLDLPQIATLAVAHDLNERLTLLSHAIWFGWESFNQIHLELVNGADLIDKQSYENTMTFAIGAEYKLNDDWTVRGGLQWDETPTTSVNRTTRTPDGNRTWFSGGATYDVNEKFSIDFAATYIDIEQGHVDRHASFDALYNLFAPGAGLFTTVDTRGSTDSDVGIIGVAVNYKF